VFVITNGYAFFCQADQQLPGNEAKMCPGPHLSRRHEAGVPVTLIVSMHMEVYNACFKRSPPHALCS
jgi:hypothetical protein